MRVVASLFVFVLRPPVITLRSAVSNMALQFVFLRSKRAGAAQRDNDVGNRLSPYRNYLLSQYAHCNIYTQTSFWQFPVLHQSRRPHGAPSTLPRTVPDHTIQRTTTRGPAATT
jgi:hypothetical protein